MTYSTWKTTKIRSSVPLSLQPRDVNVQDAPTIMTDDEEAVEHAVIVGAVKKSMATIASRRFRRKASQRLARSGLLGARFIQREMGSPKGRSGLMVPEQIRDAVI